MVELVVDGRHRDGADVILARYSARPPLVLMTAAHGLIEAISAIRRLVRADQLEAADGGRAVDWLRALDLVLDATAPRARRIWQLRDVMSAYDAAYVAGAEAVGVPLVTVDSRLLRACMTAGIAAVGLGDFELG